MFITFIYKVGRNPKTYYGKYCSDVSDDHNGLDNQVKYDLIDALNAYRKLKNLPKLTSKIHIGILSLSSNEYIPTYSTSNERKIFDFYLESENYKKNVYINGTKLHL